MEKRYQVFISSTFLDLQLERLKVQQAVMELECIPAGMEAFPAIDEEQFEFIKKVIDDCDYYLLVIGGRYGSVSDAGLSYTEMEYDYAISKNLKVIVFLHKDPDSLPVSKTDQSDKLKKKLLAFKKKVSKDRLIRFWNNADELQGLVSTSLSKTMRAFPAVGWVRGNSVPSSEVYKELNDLRKENDTLKDTVNKLNTLAGVHSLADLSDKVSILFEYNLQGVIFTPEKEVSVETSWQEIFSLIAPTLFTHASERIIRTVISDYFKDLVKNKFTNWQLEYFEISDSSFDLLRIQFRALDLVSLNTGEEEYFGNIQKALIWSLTPTGEKTLIIERALRKPDERKLKPKSEAGEAE